MPLTLFQLIARSTLVVHGRVKDGDQKYAFIDVVETFRGESPADVLRIDYRDLNLQLRGQELVVFRDGEEYALFLERPNWRKQKEKNRDLFAMFHGRRGRLLIPPESRSIPLDAVRSLGRLIDRPPEEQVDGLRALLVQPNPVLREAVLDEMARLGAFAIGDLPGLELLVRDPAPTIRGRALAMIGTVLREPGDDTEQEVRRTALEICRERARNDAVETVRVEATRALGNWDAPKDVIPDLRAIAAGDRSQSVRYQAERILFGWGVPSRVP